MTTAWATGTCGACRGVFHQVFGYGYVSVAVFFMLCAAFGLPVLTLCPAFIPRYNRGKQWQECSSAVKETYAGCIWSSH